MLGYLIKHLGFAVRRYDDQQADTADKKSATGIETTGSPHLNP